MKKAIIYLFTAMINGTCPKAKLKKDEKVKVAAVREVEEECGIKVSKLGDKICKTYHAYINKGEVVLKKTHWFSMKYKGQRIN